MKLLPLSAAIFALSVLVIPSSRATIVFSWESGYEGWQPSGFNARDVDLNLSNIGATDGNGSLAVTQVGQGFSWNIIRTNVGQDDFYNIINNAVLDGAEKYLFEMDITYRNDSVPDGVTYINASIAFNSDAGYKDIHSLAPTSGTEDITIHVSMPLNSWQIAANSSFYQMVIAVNGDWGPVPAGATIFYDNVQITNTVPEPSSFVFAGFGLLGLVGNRRRMR